MTASVRVPTSIRVGRLLISKGFFIADEYGTPCELISTRTLGVLKEEVETLKFLFGLVRLRRTRKIFLGKILFLEGNFWVFEVYGREQFELAQDLSREMSETFSAQIDAFLESESSRLSTYKLDMQI